MMSIDCSPLLKVPGAQGVNHIFARSTGLGGDAWCHLVTGTERALLIDTGFGVGDLQGICKTCTDLPIDVVNTHNHGDHTGGNPQFDKVYIHELDAPALYKSMKAPYRKLVSQAQASYSASTRGTTQADLNSVVLPGDVSFFTQEEIVQPKEYEVVPIQDGYVFDLGGGYEYEVFHLPGHSSGGIALLDRKRRMLFSGDAIVYTPTMISNVVPGTTVSPWQTVEKFRDGLLRLCEHMDEFDIVYPGHSQLGLPPVIVTDMLACCEELLAGDTSVQTYSNKGNYNHLAVHVHGMAQIAFCEQRIHVQ
jgi:glyoxylase-like metal-dependent hydrolase (beta-lactamase superfamily II)